MRNMITEAERSALANLVYEAIRFADLMAGEGICPADDADAKDPAIFLSEYVEAIGGDSWEGLAAATQQLILDGALVAQRIEQGSSKPEVTGSSPVEGTTRSPNAWHCISDREIVTTDSEKDVREFMDRNQTKWTVTPLYNITTALRACPLDQLEAEYVRRSQHA